MVLLLLSACSRDESNIPDSAIPSVKAEAFYSVLKEDNITYANGLSYNPTNNSILTIPIKLDVYSPDNIFTNSTFLS